MTNPTNPINPSIATQSVTHQSSSNRYALIIPAAGNGRRFSEQKLKQYEKVQGKSILDWTLSVWLNMPWIDTVVVVIASDDTQWSNSAFANHPKILTTCGGATRVVSVANGLRFLAGHATDWVFVHDAVRPCVTESQIVQLRDAVKQHLAGGLLGLPVRDTLKRVDHAQNVLATVDRESLWQAQTPQLFRFSVLQAAFAHCLAAENNMPVHALTDEASLVQSLQYQPLMVVGDPWNLKLTYPADLAMIAAWLAIHSTNRTNQNTNQNEE